MPMRRVLAIFAIALAVASLGYTAYWFHVAGLLRKGLESWADQRRSQGWTVSWSEMNTGGYPLHVRLDLDTPHLANPSGLAWTAERLTGNADPFNWTQLRLAAPGRHQFDGPGGHMDVTVASARADVNLDRRGIAEDATLLVSGITATGLTPEPLTISGLALAWDPLPVTKPDHSTATVRFSATAHGIMLPELPGLPLDRRVTLAEITGRIMGVLPKGPLTESVPRWSAEGGTVELDHVTLEWEPLALEGDGTIALDPAGQPLVAMSARMRGFGPLMDRLAESGTVEPSAANAAKIVLSLMAKPDAKGRPSVPVPVSLQDGALFLGPAKVAKVPQINW
ncbi:MAG: DUF2125 domain-containing protein [Rhodospirillaceae bacterium]|nr:DUF2125 domain-containing protein [Rhodospirillales bacterium]